MISSDDASIIRGASVLTPDGWRRIDVAIAAGEIVPQPSPGAVVIDGTGCLLAPGFIDLHLHGAAGALFEDGHVESARRITAALPAFGVTGILATLATLPPTELQRAVEAVAAAAGDDQGARLLGIHLEGPFLNPARAGAQARSAMRPPSLAEVDDLQRRAAGLIRLVTVAPELDGATAFIAGLRARGIAAALGHSEASEAEVLAAFDAGASHVTHLFNAMGGLHHRTPGLVGVALTDPRASVELICDGEHLHRRAVDIALRCKAEGQVVLVSDGVAVAVTDPEMNIFGHPCLVRTAVRFKASGMLAGSCVSLDQALRTVRAWFPERPLENLLPLAAAAPAAIIGLGQRYGAIRTGGAGDLVLLTPGLEVVATVCRGRVVYRRAGASASHTSPA
jgi:N-acetylglucosamine-6-phosphate deacetylase